MIPITANLVSVEVKEDSSSSSVATGTGRSKEVSMQAPIAAVNRASSANTALQELCLWWSLLNLKLGLIWIPKEGGELMRNCLNLNLEQGRESKRIIVEEEQQQQFMGTMMLRGLRCEVMVLLSLFEFNSVYLRFNFNFNRVWQTRNIKGMTTSNLQSSFNLYVKLLLQERNQHLSALNFWCNFYELEQWKKRSKVKIKKVMDCH